MTAPFSTVALIPINAPSCTTQHCPVTDRDVAVNERRKADVDVHDHAVLRVATLADDDSVGVTAKYGTVEHAGSPSQRDVPDQGRIGGDPRGWVNSQAAAGKCNELRRSGHQ
jgi:hypothetical protein